MVHPFPDTEDDKPLDPAMERVQRRMRRLMLIAGLTLGLGIFAVFAAILYKIAASGDSPPAAVATQPVDRSIAADLPSDARLVSSSVAGNRVVLTYEHAGGTTLIFVDSQSLAVVGRLELKRE